LSEKIPDLVYLVCGEGPDRDRLETKATGLGVRDRVIFTGFVPEERKTDYFRIADAYVMPSRGEGFGIVFLEAMACGIPVMGSTLDGSREALLGGELGVLANPDDPSNVVSSILSTLSRPRGVPEGLARFSLKEYQSRVAAIVRETMGVAA
jgi:glycosyltransferase involved in cell wall biosynthesis